MEAYRYNPVVWRRDQLTEKFNFVNEVLSRYIKIYNGEISNVEAKEINRILRESVHKIKVYFLCAYRIGHLAENTDDFLRKYYVDKDIFEENREVILLVNDTPIEKVCNKQLIEMINRVFPVIDDQLMLEMINQLAKDDAELWEIMGRLFNTNIDYELFNNVPSQLYFTEEEEMMGKKLLRDMGIEDGSQFLCFNNRDKTYLDQHESRINWSYHDHRDSDIENCMLTANYFADRGFYCIRMGHTVEKALLSDNPRIIDYTSNYRTDFGDIYLASKCKFWFGSATGIICVPSLFNVPTIWLNIIPFGGVVPYCSSDLYIPKKFWYKPEQRFLSYRELTESGSSKWGHISNNYDVLEIEVVENTPEEILESAKEMFERINETWEYNLEDEKLQNIVRGYFEKGDIPYGAPSRIGTEFLRRNRELFL